jgi:hypothetical protein
MAYLAELDAVEECCEECASGGSCSGGLGSTWAGLGFVIPSDGTVDPNVDNSADGSLFSFGSVENLASIIPAAFAAAPGTQYTGEAVADSAAQAAGLVAAPFTGGLSIAGASAAQAIEHMFHFGAGRHEADIITPNQNVVWQYIVNLSKVALASTDPRLLAQAVLNLQQLGYNWLRFLADPRFKDGRASAQAANTIMPYLDGSCGYAPHNIQNPATPAVFGPGPASPCKPDGCNGCDNAWPGNFGYGAGLLGALRAMVVQNGGALPPPNDVTQGVGVPTLQFPGTSGATNLGPQSGWLNNSTGWVGGLPTPGAPPYSGASFFDTSTLGIVGLVLLGGFLLSRKKAS